MPVYASLALQGATEKRTNSKNWQTNIFCNIILQPEIENHGGERSVYSVGLSTLSTDIVRRRRPLIGALCQACQPISRLISRTV